MINFLHLDQGAMPRVARVGMNIALMAFMALFILAGFAHADTGVATSETPAAWTAGDSAALVVLSSDDTLAMGLAFQEGDVITTQGGAMLKLPDGSDVEMEQNTSVEVKMLARVAGHVTTTLHLRRGAVRVVVPRRPTARAVIFRVTTPVSTAGVRGTDFSVAYEPDATAVDAAADAEANVDVFDGTVDVNNSGATATRAVTAGNGATVNRRAVRRRAVSEAMRERWENRREQMIEHLRTRLNLGPDDDVAEALRERLKNLSPEKRQQVIERIRGYQEKVRARVRTRAEAAHERREDHREAVQERREERRDNGQPVVPRRVLRRRR